MYYKHVSFKGGSMRKTVAVLGVLLVVAAGNAFASGLAIPEQGAAALSMAAAMTARNEDLSAIFYNPAGLDYVQGFEVYAGITPIMPVHKYSPFSKDDKYFDKLTANKNVYLPPQLYAAWRAQSHVVLGLGVYAPFGLGTDWNKTWAGRYTSTFAEITTIYINPTVAINVTDQVSFGFGVSYITSDATIRKMVNTGASTGLGTNTNYDTEFDLEGDGSAWGFNAGLLYRPSNTVQLGASYRWAYDMDYDGDAKFKLPSAFKNLPGGVVNGNPITLYQALSTKMPATQTGSATLAMPWMLNLGAKFVLNEQWDTSVDLDLVGWETYEELKIDFDKNLPADESVVPKNWENSVILRGGLSYKYTQALVFRGGILFDKNPVPDETIDGQLPDANRWGFSLGAGYTFGKIKIDAGYMILTFNRREKDNGAGFDVDSTKDGKINRFDVPTGYPTGNGMYDSYAHLLSVAASYHF